ncbi:MAG TPA: DinB family protein, partial [Aggregatilineales bacterium]|nr:DinB family protein [Aggregatilineales bacterium]
IYPAAAIKQRLIWAGLDPVDGQYARITNAENSHFTKPHPHYFEEIMAHISLEPYEAIMVGDSLRNDIDAGVRTGMTTYWVHEPGVDVPESADASGSLADFAACVAQGWLETLPSKLLEPAHIIPRLTASIAALHGTVHGIPDRFWNQRPDPKEWTPLEVVMHLKEYELESRHNALQMIVTQDNPFIRGATLPPQPGERDLSGCDGWEVVHQFVQERQQTIAYLESLPADAWNRPARHGFYGPTTLLDMAAILTRHDQLHIRQLCQTIGQCE